MKLGEAGGGCCKEWWDGNSFTAGRPQGSTFSTGTLSWKRERGSCYCFWCEVKGHHDIQALSHTDISDETEDGHALWEEKEKPWVNRNLSARTVISLVRVSHIQVDVKTVGSSETEHKINLIFLFKNNAKLFLIKLIINQYVCRFLSCTSEIMRKLLIKNLFCKSYQIAFCYPDHFTLRQTWKRSASVWLKVPHYACLHWLQRYILYLFCSGMSAKPKN